MAEVKLLADKVNNDRRLAYWLDMQNGDVGEPADWAYLPDNTATAYGHPWGSGGSVSLFGSNDGNNWHQLFKTDHTMPCTWTQDNMIIILERPRFIRPQVTAGDGNTLIDVHIMFR